MKTIIIAVIATLTIALTGCSTRVYPGGYDTSVGYYGGYGPGYYGYGPYYRRAPVIVRPAPRVYYKNRRDWNRSNRREWNRNNGYRNNNSYRGGKNYGNSGGRTRGPR